MKNRTEKLENNVVLHAISVPVIDLSVPFSCIGFFCVFFCVCVVFFNVVDLFNFYSYLPYRLFLCMIIVSVGMVSIESVNTVKCNQITSSNI